MMMEAIRLSLAAEEERKRKADKGAAKEAKKRAKEEKKKEKRERKGVYGSGASSASGSALSLSLASLGRRRGNSGGSNLAREIVPESSETPVSKGKGVDRSNVTSAPSMPSAPIDFARPGESSGMPGVRHLDTNTLANIDNLHQPSPSPTAPEKPSHLRQMSNASSPASSFVESVPGSLRNDFHGHGSSSSLDTPNAFGTNVAGHTGNTPDTGGDSNETEPLFNFQSLAAMIGHDDEDKEDAAKHIEHLNGGESSTSHEQDSASLLEESIATLKIDDRRMNGAVAQDSDAAKHTTLLEPQSTTPEVMITPVTPAATNHDEHDGKQLGAGWREQIASEITQ